MDCSCSWRSLSFKTSLFSEAPLPFQVVLQMIPSVSSMSNPQPALLKHRVSADHLTSFTSLIIFNSSITWSPRVSSHWLPQLQTPLHVIDWGPAAGPCSACTKYSWHSPETFFTSWVLLGYPSNRKVNTPCKNQGLCYRLTLRKISVSIHFLHNLIKTCQIFHSKSGKVQLQLSYFYSPGELKKAYHLSVKNWIILLSVSYCL